MKLIGVSEAIVRLIFLLHILADLTLPGSHPHRILSVIHAGQQYLIIPSSSPATQQQQGK